MNQKALSKWNPEMCCAYIWQPHALEVRDRYAFWQWKWNEGGLCPTWRQELGPMPGTGRSFILSLGTYYMLISTEETSFSFLHRKRWSQCWLRSLDGLRLPSWPASRPASCPSLSWRHSFDKVLGPLWKSLFFCSPKKNEFETDGLIWHFSSCVQLKEEGLLETVPGLSLGVHIAPQHWVCTASRSTHLGGRVLRTNRRIVSVSC